MEHMAGGSGHLQASQWVNSSWTGKSRSLCSPQTQTIPFCHAGNKRGQHGISPNARPFTVCRPSFLLDVRIKEAGFLPGSIPAIVLPALQDCQPSEVLCARPAIGWKQQGFCQRMEWWQQEGHSQKHCVPCQLLFSCPRPTSALCASLCTSWNPVLNP